MKYTATARSCDFHAAVGWLLGLRNLLDTFATALSLNPLLVYCSEHTCSVPVAVRMGWTLSQTTCVDMNVCF